MYPYHLRLVAGSALLAIATSAPALAQPTAASPGALKCADADNRSRAMLGYAGLITPQTVSLAPDGQAAVTAAVAPVPAVPVTGNGGTPLGYTRLSLRFEPCSDAGARGYGGETRGWVRRMFVGLKTDKSLTLRVTVDPTDVSRTTGLTRISRDSTKKGDVWATEFNDGAILMPYFLVDKSTVVSLDVAFLASSDYSSEVASGMLSLVQKAAEAINPAATLITSENKDRFNRASNFVDETVNGLLRRSIAERALTVHLPTNLTSGREIARVMLMSPPANVTVNNQATMPIGIWSVHIEGLTKSLFGTPDAGNRLASSELSAATILSLRVADNKTLGETLASRPAVVVARDNYNKATNEAQRDSTGAEFCGVVAREVALMGLAPVDVGAAAWAAATDLAAAADRRRRLRASCAGTDNFPT